MIISSLAVMVISAAGQPKMLQYDCLVETTSRCPIPARASRKSTCDLTRAVPASPSWQTIRKDYVLCTNLFYDSPRYIVVSLSSEFRKLLHAVLGVHAPEKFALCYYSAFCNTTEAVELLVPFHFLYLHRSVSGQPIHPNDLLLYDRLVDAFESKAGRNGTEQHHVLEQDKLLDVIYKHARTEAFMSLPVDQQTARTTGAICMVGQPRTFPMSRVYLSLHHNLIKSLGFTELAIIYIFDLSFTDSASYKTPIIELDDLATPFALMPPTVLVTEPVNFEGHNPNGTCALQWPFGCNAQFKSLEMCLEQVRWLERSRGSHFDWIVRVRPDLRIPMPLDDIRTYSASAVHGVIEWSNNLWDGFALVPRSYADVYFNARQFGATEYCWLQHELPKMYEYDACCTRLLMHLQANDVRVAGTFPVNIRHSLVRPAEYWEHMDSSEWIDNATYPMSKKGRTYPYL